MTSTVEALNGSQQLAAVRLVAATNQTVTFFNGPLNNGVQGTLTYATGVLTIDSVVANLNDYILIAGQTAAYQNGIYQVTTAGAVGVAAVLQRRGDFQCIEQIRVGHYVPVGAGTVYGGSMWTVIEPKPAAIGVPVVSGANNIEFATITASGSGLFLEAANNLSDVATPATAVTNLGFTHPAANTLASTGALVSGNLVAASGTAGLVADTGIAAAGVPSSVQVAMTAAQFNGMYAAPVLLVAAPGANSMIVVDSIALVMTYGSAAFAAGGVVAAQYDSTANGAGVIASTTEAAADYFATASTVFKLNPGAVLAPFTTCANKGLYLSNITQAFTTGTGSAFIVKVRYHVISTVA